MLYPRLLTWFVKVIFCTNGPKIETDEMMLEKIRDDKGLFNHILRFICEEGRVCEAARDIYIERLTRELILGKLRDLRKLLAFS